MLERQKRRILIPFLAPALILYGLFFAWPTLQAFASTVTDWQGVTLNRSFVGAANFQQLAADPLFAQTLMTTASLVVIGGAILFPLAIVLAFATSERVRGTRFFMFVILAPLAISVVAAALLWKFAYDPNFGIINGVLEMIGAGAAAQSWLGQTSTALVAVALVIVWQGIGTYVLFFAAAIANIPPELQEASRIDGATPWQTFRNVTFPLIWDVTRVLILLWIISALQEFVFVWAMTKGGPLNSTETVGIDVYFTAFQARQWAYATTVAVTLFLIMIAIAVVFTRLTRRDVVEY